MVSKQVSKIARINDQFRRTFKGGQVVTTQGVDTLDKHEKYELFKKIQEHSRFHPDNDPRGEHDFGLVFIGSIYSPPNKFFWKIDYYDLHMNKGSEDPGNIEITQRVLTIMRADEY